ncbi:DUF1972 domain-containing protein [Sphingomonas sp. IW22]|uniref:DUF1972 domain-containing protein n=1 Tax=Sphingomonas sp. IW22 TaxID=3242489 RepID=UPI003520EBE5
MKLAIIGTDGLPARYGGFETFAMEVSPCLAALGHEVRVIGSSIGRAADERGPEGVSIRNLPLRANGIASIPFDLASLAAVARWAEAVILLGVSAGPFVPAMRRFVRGGNLIVNVDGLESRRMKWSPLGRRYLAWAERVAIHGAKHVVADNDAIADIIREEHHRASLTIAYGCDHVRSIKPSDRRRILASFSLEENTFLLTVARIEPENNIEMMLDAVDPQVAHPYAIVGNFSSTEYGRMIWKRYSNRPGIRLIGPTYDPDALAALRSGCHIYLHGHSVGGTNPSLVEMLPYARPILAYDCSFNRSTMRNEGGYFASSADLRTLLMRGDAERYTPSLSLRDDPRYQWQTIAQHYASLAMGE